MLCATQMQSLLLVPEHHGNRDHPPLPSHLGDPRLRTSQWLPVSLWGDHSQMRPCGPASFHPKLPLRLARLELRPSRRGIMQRQCKARRT
jgi:hypothetical protein